MIRGGDVPVKEIEDLLVRHPRVRAAAVVAAPHDRLGEIGCAFVITEGNVALTLAEMRDHLRDLGVTHQFWPERLEVLAELPLTPSGKVQQYKLRELAAGS
ncbi:MAG TPA: hypothetical protein VM262_03455 [Acidimicrobiales bacterium]|nr:hypothetical protein [Acidimicrobiales bacterium]